MGFFDVFKKSRKQVNRDNQEQGRAGEKKIKDEYEFSGYKVSRTGKGHDLKAEKKDWFGKKTTKYIEVKTGNSKLSKLQKKKRGYLGDKYVVERLEPTPFGLSTNNRESDKPKKRKKKSSSSIFGSSSMDSIFGSSSMDSIFGSSSMDSIFGSSSSTKKKTTKKKSTPKKKQTSIWGSSSSMDSIFGSSTKKKTSKKKKSTKNKSDSIW
jgi:hypothetical protein